MNKFTSFMLAAAAMAFCAQGLFAGGGADSGGKVYVFATDATWPPMEFVNDEGEIVGFDIDLMAAVAEASGFEYEVRNTAWDGIFAGLANGAYDGILSSVTILDERKETMDFSVPYVNAGLILVVRADYAGGDQLEDFVGKKVGAQQGTTGDFAIEAISGIERRAYDDLGLAVEDMVNGNLDAVVCDSVTGINYVADNENFAGKLKILGEPFTEQEFGIAVRKGDTELLQLIDDGLAEVFADGTHAELVEKWLR